MKRQASIFEKGDFYLSAKEEEMVSSVVKLFENVAVVLNAGGMVDVSWIKNCRNIKDAIHAFLGGMEGGSVVADLLVGDSCPSGRLTDTYRSNRRTGEHRGCKYLRVRQSAQLWNC